MMNYQRHAIGINMPQAPQTSYIQPAIQMPAAQVPRQKPQRALVGFGNVPKFTPPDYAGVAPEDLPCPDTPSPRGSLASSPEDEKGFSPTGHHLAEDYIMSGARAESTRNHRARQVNNNMTNNNNMNDTRNKAALTTPSKDGVVSTTATKKEDASGGEVFPPGSFVEYRSRTMQDRWILAKVEAFDDKNRVYKLDVQPKAPMDRVRLRQSNGTARVVSESNTGIVGQHPPSASQSAATQQHQQADVANTIAAQEKKSGEKRKVDALHDVIDPYEDEKLTMMAGVQEMGEQELRSRMEQLVKENISLKQQLDAERQRTASLEAQLRHNQN